LGVIAMNMPSLDKYESLVASGGVLVVNSSLMTRKATRTDIRIIEIPANAIAEEFGNNKMANIVLLGALIAATGAMPLKDIEDALRNHLPERHRKLLEANFQALRKGAEMVEMVKV
jgi:2-oxoglutarate ferredoxin oxidoreductase subunit gamma